MPKKLMLLAAVPALALVAFASSPVLAQEKEKTRNEALAEVREQGAASEQRPGDRVFYDGDIQYNCDEAFRVLDRYQAVEPTTPGYDEFAFNFGFAEAEENVRRCIDEYGVLPRDGEDPIEDAEARPTSEAKAVRAKEGWAGWDKVKELPDSGGVPADVVPLLGLGVGALIVGSGLLVRKAIR